MDYELKIGDAVVSCRDHDAERADARDRKAACRFAPSCEEIPGEVDAFCAALSGIPSLDYVIARALAPVVPLPQGFRHFRLFTPGENSPFHRTIRVEDSAIELTSRSVLYAVLCWPAMEVTAWSRTVRRPTSIAGVLDLDVHITAHEGFGPLRIRE